MRLFDYLDSGNGYTVRLLLALLGYPYDWTPLDIDRGETRTISGRSRPCGAGWSASPPSRATCRSRGRRRARPS
jgi:hypothetical protein